jgi:transposase
MKRFTIVEFREKFSNDDVCLDHLFKIRYEHLLNCPKCNNKANFARVADRRSYQCLSCAYQLYPTAGTVFHKTTTPLTYWFYAIYLFTVTRNGVAAKELERQLNVCYKTALRMAHQIKKLMMDEPEYLLSGEIIIDESFIGGALKNAHGKRAERLRAAGADANKVGVVGMINKQGKRIITQVIEPNELSKKDLEPIIKSNVDRSSVVVTDGHGGYKDLRKTFSDHKVINHQDGFYAWEGYSTNRIENYWSGLKRMLKGTHISVSKRHLPKYIAENSFRYVNRDQPEKMFDIILSRVL